MKTRFALAGVLIGAIPIAASAHADVTTDASSMTIQCEPATSNPGTSVDCGAGVRDLVYGWRVMSGTVTFSSSDGTFEPGSCEIGSPTGWGSMDGWCDVAFTPSKTGTIAVQAHYSGGTWSCPGCSSDVTRKVGTYAPTDGATSITVLPPSTTQDPTRTTMTCASGGSGQPLTCTATVTDLARPSSAPSGTILFWDGDCATVCSPGFDTMYFSHGPRLGNGQCEGPTCTVTFQPYCDNAPYGCAWSGSERIHAVYEGEPGDSLSGVPGHATSSAAATVSATGYWPEFCGFPMCGF